MTTRLLGCHQQSWSNDQLHFIHSHNPINHEDTDIIRSITKIPKQNLLSEEMKQERPDRSNSVQERERSPIQICCRYLLPEWEVHTTSVSPSHRWRDTCSANRSRA